MRKTTRSKGTVQEESAERIAMIFCRTVALPLGIVRLGKYAADPPIILNEPHFDGVCADVLALLEKKWSESELKERIFQAGKEKRKGVLRVSELVIGCTPAQLKRDPQRNLLAEKPPTRYHRLLAKRTQPKVQFFLDALGDVRPNVVRSAETGPVRDTFTLEDLREYWELQLLGHTVTEPAEQTFGSLGWTVEHNDLSDILWAIDMMAKESGDWDPSRRVTAFDLKPYLQQQTQAGREAAIWLNQ